MTNQVNGACLHPATREEPADKLGLVPVHCRMCGKLVRYRMVDRRKKKVKVKR